MRTNAAAGAPAGAARSSAAAGAPAGAARSSAAAGAPAAAQSALTAGTEAWEAELSEVILCYMRGRNEILRGRDLSPLEAHIEAAGIVLPPEYKLTRKLARMSAHMLLRAVHHPDSGKIMGIILPEWSEGAEGWGA